MLGVLATITVAGGITYLVTRDPNYRVERAIQINSDAARVFAVLSDFHQFPHWSPWEKLDASMQKTFEGEAGTVGSSYSWSGNNKVGQGCMTVVEVQPGEGLDIRLEFYKPFVSTAFTRWSVTGDANQCIVTWTMKGKHPSFVSKVFGLLMRMEGKLKHDFDEGLARLKAYCEGQA